MLCGFDFTHLNWYPFHNTKVISLPRISSYLQFQRYAEHISWASTLHLLTLLYYYCDVD